MEIKKEYISEEIISFLKELGFTNTNDLELNVLTQFKYDLKTNYFKIEDSYDQEEVKKFFEKFLILIYDNFEEIKKDKKEEAIKLTEDLIIASNHVYRHGSLLVSDELYDGQEDITKLKEDSEKKHLYNLLKKLDPKNKMFKEHLLEFPLVDVNGNMVNKQEYHPLGGKGNTLSKTSVISDMRNEFEKLKETQKVINISEKLDGSSLYLTYDNMGRLIRAVTRGDSIKGEDVTVNALKVPSIPKEIDVSSLEITKEDRIQVRGEVVFFKDKFEKVNEKREEGGKKKYANPRNSTAGIMSELTGSGCKELDFMMFELLKIKNAKKRQESVERYNFKEKKEFNEKNDFLKPNSWEVKEFSEFLEIFNKYEEGSSRTELNYQIDGLVVVGQGDFGVNKNNTASYGYATKFSPSMVKAKVIDVEYNIEKAGIISSVILLEPIDIDGTFVSRVSLANKYSKGINELLRTISKGDEINIVKSGDIIPKILWNTKFEEHFKEIYYQLEVIFEKENFTKDPKLNIEYMVGLLDYVSKIAKLRPNPENKNINLKYKQYFSEILTSNNEVIIDMEKVVIKILDEYDKEFVSVKQKEINGLKIGERKEGLKEELKKVKKEIKATKKEVLDSKIKIPKEEIKYERDNENVFKYITSCPKCSSELTTLEDGVKTVMCINPNCEGVLLSTLEKYAQTIGGKGIDIGRKTIEFLHKTGKLNKFEDFYKITKEDFKENGEFYEGWKEKSISNLISNINKLREAKDKIFFKSLNIREFSESTSLKLFQSISLGEILEINYLNEEEVENLKVRLLEINGFGDLMVSYLINYMKTEKENVISLLNIVDITEKTKILTEEEKGAKEISIVLTGTIEEGSLDVKGSSVLWEDRKGLKSNLDKKILKTGSKIKVSSAISGNTDYIVSDDDNVKKIVLAIKEGREEDAYAVINTCSSKIKDFVNKLGGNPESIITTKEMVGLFSNINNNKTKKTEKSGPGMII